MRRYRPLLWLEFSIHPHATRLSTFWDIHRSRIGETWRISFLAVGLQILLLQILWVLPSCESLSPHHWFIFSWPFHCSVQGWLLRGGVIELWYSGEISSYTWYNRGANLSLLEFFYVDGSKVLFVKKVFCINLPFWVGLDPTKFWDSWFLRSPLLPGAVPILKRQLRGIHQNRPPFLSWRWRWR